MHTNLHTLKNSSIRLSEYLADNGDILEFTYMHTEYTIVKDWIDPTVYHVQTKKIKNTSKRRMKKAFDRLVYVINAIKGFN